MDLQRCAFDKGVSISDRGLRRAQDGREGIPEADVGHLDGRAAAHGQRGAYPRARDLSCAPAGQALGPQPRVLAASHIAQVGERGRQRAL